MIKILRGELVEEHTYLYVDDTTKHAFIIDPGLSGDKIVKYAEEEGITIEKILITHGHFDHIKGVKELHDSIGAPIYIHTEGKTYITNAVHNLSTGFFDDPIEFEAEYYVQEGYVITLDANPDFSVKVIHVPGHSADGVAFYNEKEGVAFVGDIIFAGGVGRSDLFGGNSLQLLNGIRAKIFTLPENTVLYPGHGPSTTVEREKLTNPIFNMFD